MQLTPHFSLDEMTVSQTAARRGLSNRPTEVEIQNLRQLCGNILEPLRRHLGPVVVNSGFRSRIVNKVIGGSSTSQHCFGQAADIIVPGHTIAIVCSTIRKLGLPYDQLIDEFGQWVHVSYSPRHRREFLLARRNRSGHVEYKPGA